MQSGSASVDPTCQYLEQDSKDLRRLRGRAFDVCIRTEDENQASNNGIETQNMAIDTDKDIDRHKVIKIQM